MRTAALAHAHDVIGALVPAHADFVDAAKKVDVDAQLAARRPWVKLYMPSEEGDRHPIETYLVTIDCGAHAAEPARALAELVRTGLAGDRRAPSPFRRRRVTGLDEGTFYRVQLSYQLQRPAL